MQRCWPRATPEFGSVSVISSFLLQDVPRHPETRLLGVREAFIRSLLHGFQAHIRAYTAFFSPPVAALRGPSRGPSRGALRGPLRGACAPAARNRRRSTSECPAAHCPLDLIHQNGVCTRSALQIGNTINTAGIRVSDLRQTRVYLVRVYEQLRPCASRLTYGYISLRVR